MNRPRTWWLLAVGSLALAACSSGASATRSPATTTSTTLPPTTTSTTSTTVPPPTTTTTAPPPPVPVSPETGLPDPTGQSLTRPALWVKIENTPEARPQSGLSQADVVFEQVTEGGITRFITLFNSDIPDVVGPVRSTRAMDSDVTGALGGVFAYSGGIPQSVQLITHAPVTAVDESAAGKAMFRDRSKKAPHNLFAHAADLLQFGGTQPTPPPALFQYLPAGQAFNGDPVGSFTVDFDPPYAPTYTWDATNNVWTRAIGSKPFVDASGQQIAPTNVVVQFVPCCLPVPEGGTYITVGSGEAWVFSGAKMVKGTWSRGDRSQVTSFVDANNQPIQLAPGRTWVEYVPNGQNVDVAPPAPPDPAPPASSTP